MKRNLVALVGRPNTGKSTLFNKLIGKRISIVKDEPGITRDRIYADCEWCGKTFTLVDTGGIDFSGSDDMQGHIIEQAKIAIDLADVIVLVVDGVEGITAADHKVAEVLRKTNKHVIIAVNKIENATQTQNSYEFYELGYDKVFNISALHGTGSGDLLDEIVDCFAKESKIEEEEEDKPLSIALVGKPNAGKSSIANKLLGEKRMVVSNVAGTTRDAVDLPFKVNKKDYILIDTAGLRKKSAIEDESVELYSILRSLDAVRRCDVAVLVVDASEGITDQDLKIANFILEQGKPSIIAINKWDLIDKDPKSIKIFNDELTNKLMFMSYFKAIYISAETNKNIATIVPSCETVYENANRRITTGTLNEIMHEAFSLSQPPAISGKKLKLLYATQAETNPPTFVLFVNNATIMQKSYLRYLENFLRKTIDFTGVPIVINLKSKKEEDL